MSELTLTILANHGNQRTTKRLRTRFSPTQNISPITVFLSFLILSLRLPAKLHGRPAQTQPNSEKETNMSI
jgi:hypothetical protein